MSTCQGAVPVGTKVDRGMSEFVESEISGLGVSKAEFHRRLLELYRESRREDVDCPHCGDAVVLDLRVDA